MTRKDLLLKGGAVLVMALWVVSSAAPAARAADAKELYGKYCNSCHGPDGKGDGPSAKMLKPPPPAFSTAIKEQTDADLARLIKEGGKAVGKSVKMPAFGSKLTDDQIHSLVEYAKGLGAK